MDPATTLVHVSFDPLVGGERLGCQLLAPVGQYFNKQHVQSAFADVLPTFADLAGVPLTAVPRVKTNGTSIRPLLNDSPESIPERTLYWEFGKQVGDPNSGVVGDVFQAARRGKWKAVRYGKDAAIQLFDLDSDPGETNELSQQRPDIHREFTELFQAHAG